MQNAYVLSNKEPIKKQRVLGVDQVVRCSFGATVLAVD